MRSKDPVGVTNFPWVADTIARNGDASALRVFLLRANVTDNYGVTYRFASIWGDVLIPNYAEGVSTFRSLLFFTFLSFAYHLT